MEGFGIGLALFTGEFWFYTLGYTRKENDMLKKIQTATQLVGTVPFLLLFRCIPQTLLCPAIRPHNAKYRYKGTHPKTDT